MFAIRHLITCTLLLALAIPPAYAQSTSAEPSRLNMAAIRQMVRLQAGRTVNVQQRPVVAASLHPAAKGAVIGAAAGAGAWGAIGLWYCTVGPNEVGECRNSSMWTRGFLLWGAAGAGIGALIGALR